jgi:hypothetical protein
MRRSIVNVDCLLDAVQALVADCDHPALRKIKNIDAFVNRCKSSLKFYLVQEMKNYAPLVVADIRDSEPWLYFE